MRDSVLARAARRVEAWPFASLLLCVVLAAVQFGLLLFLALGTEHDGNRGAEWLKDVLTGLLFLLPAGSLYGLYLARKPAAAKYRAVPRVLGFVANGLYLLVGILI